MRLFRGPKATPDMNLSYTLRVIARQQLIDLARLGRGSAAAVIIFVCIFAFVILYTRLVKVEEV